MTGIGTMVDILLPGGLGFFIGAIFGVFLASLMNAASMDSRMRERMEEESQRNPEEIKIEKRTAEEKKAWVEGFNFCFKKFCECLEVEGIEAEETIRKMEIYKAGAEGGTE